LGARQEIVERVAEVLKPAPSHLENCRVTEMGIWQPAEEAEVVQGIKRAQPEMLFVAMARRRKRCF